jgi:hypothetical protein
VQNAVGIDLVSDLRIFIEDGFGSPDFGALHLKGPLGGPGRLIKLGSGLISLTGESNPLQAIGGLMVFDGKVRVDGNYPVPVVLSAAGQLTGNGVVGEITGTGLVNLATGVLTANSIAGPVLRVYFDHAGENGNGLLRLTESGSGETVSLRINGIVRASALQAGDRLRGGLFLPEQFDLDTVDLRLFVPDANGNHIIDGERFRAAVAADELYWRIVGDSISFEGENIAGYVTEILKEGEPETFEQWLALEIDDPQQRNDPDFADRFADPFETGFPNLLRYALGLGWMEEPGGLLPLIKVPNGSAAIKFRYNPGLSDISYQISTSSDMIDWDEIVFDSDQDSTPELDNGWIVIPLENHTKPFFRLNIHQQSE